MIILRQLSKLFIILFTVTYAFKVFSNEPVDIWNIEKKKEPENNSLINIEETIDLENNQVIKIDQKNDTITVDESLASKEIKLAGLYDPEQNRLSIDMWSNSDGEKIKEIITNLYNKNLSSFSEKVLDVALLTNSYFPTNNITTDEFLDFKLNHLIYKKDYNLIKQFVIKNSSTNNTDKIIRYYADHYLSNSELDNACEIFDYTGPLNDNYLISFKIYCLFHQERIEEAQLLFDLNTELENLDNFFKKKFNILMNYEKADETSSEKNILFFHLSHKTLENFEYTPKLETPKFIWSYLASSNLLKDSNLIDIENSDQIKLMEKATQEGIYNEQELFRLYRRFQFDINQLLNYDDAYKLLEPYQARALLYQRLLLSNDNTQKLDISSKIKRSFEGDGLPNVFDGELKNILKSISEENIPSNFTTFYEQNREIEEIKDLKIKYNNKIFHQSKLISYFQNKVSLPDAEKEANDLLKKIKKDKKYTFSVKDIMMTESLKSDGIQILKKYDDLYEYKSSIPSDINSMIVNRETGLVLLKIAQITGEDEIEDLDIESINYIVGILNELKMVDLRNQILLKVLPLKV